MVCMFVRRRDGKRCGCGGVHTWVGVLEWDVAQRDGRIEYAHAQRSGTDWPEMSVRIGSRSVRGSLRIRHWNRPRPMMDAVRRKLSAMDGLRRTKFMLHVCF